MTNRDAKSLLLTIAQERPATRSWREQGNHSPEYSRFMEEIEKVQVKLTATTPKFNPFSVLRSVQESAAAEASNGFHRNLRFSDEDMTESARRDNYRTSQPTMNRRSPHQSSTASTSSRPIYRPSRLSPESPPSRNHRAVESRRLNMNPATSIGAQRVIHTLNASSSLFTDSRSIEERMEEHFSRGTGDHVETISFVNDDMVRETEITPSRGRNSDYGRDYRQDSGRHYRQESGEGYTDLEEEEEEYEEINHDISQTDDMDASERFARELAAQEEAEFLERLHTEQQRALAQLRASGTAAGQTWIDLSDEEEREAEDEPNDGLDYDELLNLGERLGDVKTERWRQRSAAVAGKLPRIMFSNMQRTLPMYRDEMCVICQFSFEPNDELKLMPNCTHCFHTDCADAWIKDHDACATCKALLE